MCCPINIVSVFFLLFSCVNIEKYYNYKKYCSKFSILLVAYNPYSWKIKLKMSDAQTFFVCNYLKCPVFIVSSIFEFLLFIFLLFTFIALHVFVNDLSFVILYNNLKNVCKVQNTCALAQDTMNGFVHFNRLTNLWTKLYWFYHKLGIGDYWMHRLNLEGFSLKVMFCDA